MLDQIPRKVLTLFALPLAIVTSTGCDSAGKKTDAEQTSTKQVKTTDTGIAKGAVKPAAAPVKPEPLVEHDLGPAHADWKGWVAKAPKNAKVMADGVKGARLAAKGPNALERARGKVGGFDLRFSPKKMDLATTKKNIQKGADNSKGKLKLEWLVDKPDHLEWLADGYGTKSWSFAIHMKVDGRDVTCSNNHMMGIGSKVLLEQHKEACKTLKKK